MSERTIVSRDEFFSAALQVKREDVTVPELGEGKVIPVWQMTSRELTNWERSNDDKNAASVRERFVVAVCRDDSGVALFTQADVAQLAKCNASMIERLIDVGRRLNTTTQAQLDDAKKNSEETIADA